MPRSIHIKERRNAYRRGLTLVEVVISIVILAVLAGLLLAALQTIKGRAASTLTQNHLRAMGPALLAHAVEHQGHLIEGAHSPALPQGELSSSRGPAVAFWFNALDFYMGGRDATLAGMKSAKRPSWQSDPKKRYPQWYRSTGGYGLAIGYGWNHQHFGYDANPLAPNGKGWGSRLSEVTSPSQTIIIGTGEDSLNETNLIRNVMIYGNSIRCRRHDGGGYYLFLDGHIEKLTPEEVMADNSYLMRKIK